MKAEANCLITSFLKTTVNSAGPCEWIANHRIRVKVSIVTLA